jgi:hypothetical protein
VEPLVLLLLLPLVLGRRGSSAPARRYDLERYEPGSDEQIELFAAAAASLGAPRSWASSYSLRKLLLEESGGWVGIPNYEFGPGITKSENRDQWPAIWEHLRAGGSPPKGRGATGLGQLVLTTVDRHYPDGRLGIGDPWNEAVGMLSYIKARYKTPDRAWECYEANSCFSGPGIDGYPPKTWRGY